MLWLNGGVFNECMLEILVLYIRSVTNIDVTSVCLACLLLKLVEPIEVFVGNLSQIV
jgi:hypothetical protein